MYLPYYVYNVEIRKFTLNAKKIRSALMRPVSPGSLPADNIILYYIIYLILEIVHHQGEKEKKKGENFVETVKNIKKQCRILENNE